ncbi:hypothetical protein KFL_002830170 [Klebsormidium nitens]|uniref:Checkpoint protein n=1 Tax=Klebsormidium nitens TaxID=105231 RepID=A0A1Y1I5V7_KLENI|nr:hypothetical protein KFL_002830170 [Klebsormidium nitens]|eukprot:GAQ86340.1 hypothetical protein KFL_002830170 [Klebsormidium nitens]
MKFKAAFTDRGVNILEKRFVPAFEKIGKTCHVYLTRDHVILLHNVLNSDGVQAIAQLAKDAIFDDYRISSQNNDCIAFQVDLSLLLRALRSSVAMDGDKLQVKLVKKRASLTEKSMPFLTFESKGYRSAILQDVPISPPLSRADVADLQAALDAVQDLPPTLVGLPDLVALQALVERLKAVGEVLDVGLTQAGDLFLRVITAFVSIGTQFRHLRVLGIRGAAAPVDDTVEGSARLQRALEQGEASVVKVNMKHFVRSLQCHLTKPDACYCGVAPGNACLLMMFQYFAPGTRLTDDSISLQYRLPVLEQDD